MIVLTPHSRVLTLAGTTAGRAVLTRLLSAVALLLADQEQAAAVLARAATDSSWQCQFEAVGDILNMLASQLHRAMPSRYPFSSVSYQRSGSVQARIAVGRDRATPQVPQKNAVRSSSVVGSHQPVSPAM